MDDSFGEKVEETLEEKKKRNDISEKEKRHKVT